MSHPPSAMPLRCPLAVIAVILVATSLGSGEARAAEVYRWIDANGNVHFSDRPSSSHHATRMDVQVVNSYEHVSVEPIGVSPSGHVTSAAVTLYTTEWCRHCRTAKAHLDRRGIPYVDRDIEKSPDARAEHKKLGGTGVPLILFGEHKMKGFDASRFDRLYDS